MLACSRRQPCTEAARANLRILDTWQRLRKDQFVAIRKPTTAPFGVSTISQVVTSTNPVSGQATFDVTQAVEQAVSHRQWLMADLRSLCALLSPLLPALDRRLCIAIEASTGGFGSQRTSQVSQHRHTLTDVPGTTVVEFCQAATVVPGGRREDVQRSLNRCRSGQVAGLGAVMFHGSADILRGSDDICSGS